MTNFPELKLIAPLLRALDAEGYTTPTPIQAKAIPHLLAGRDVMGIAQTGTGKTAAFALPILQRLAEASGRGATKSPRALILAPTRELAGQIGEAMRTYGRNLKLRHEVVFGGVPINRQIARLRGGVDILVATPGRLLDLMRQKQVSLDRVEVFVLDEADRMLDMGFIPDVKRIAAAVPSRRQTALFSATMAPPIAKLAAGLLADPVRVEVTPAATTVERIDQRVLFVTKAQKRAALAGVLKDAAVERVLVFTRTKHGANKVVQNLEADGVAAGAIHGNKSQAAREKALAGFKTGRIRVLVATDIASRGIDVDGVTHVINFELPNEPESYVHRIGRTARNGAAGIAISFCDSDERGYLRDIERTIRRSLTVGDSGLPPVPANDAGPARAAQKRHPHRHRRNGQGSGQGGRRAVA